MNDPSELSLGALRRAQRSLTKARPPQDMSDSSSSSSSSSSSDSEPDEDQDRHKPSDRKTQGKVKKDIPKRPHKHAPVEMTSKRPITRRRTVVDDHTPVSRDPRFQSHTGEFDQEKFCKQYSFLSELHDDELHTLRGHYKRARRLLPNSPRDVRAERSAEVARLERAVKRAESAVNRDAQQRIEKEALHRAAQTEREKRRQGKRPWFMKQSEKKELLDRARYEALSAAGGRQAVKKAIEKKQKKISQKEKRSRPFAKGGRSSQGDSVGATGAGLNFGENMPSKRKRPAGVLDGTSQGTKRIKVVAGDG